MTPNTTTPSRRHAAALSRLPLGALLLALALLPAAQAQTQENIFYTVKPGETTLTQAGQLERKGLYAEALVKVEKAISEEPDQARPRFLKGVILMDMKRLDEASAVFQNLRESFPELPEPYNNLAVIQMQQGRFEQAKSLLEIAVQAHPAYAAAHENLGDVYARLAGEEYAQAARLTSANAGVSRKLQIIRDLIAATPAK